MLRGAQWDPGASCACCLLVRGALTGSASRAHGSTLPPCPGAPLLQQPLLVQLPPPFILLAFHVLMFSVLIVIFLSYPLSLISFLIKNTCVLGFSWWINGKESTCPCRKGRFNRWIRKIPWRRKWQPTPVFLPGKSHGQRKLQKSQTQLSDWTTITTKLIMLHLPV